jgi:LEA14-like dessication related protein
MGKKYVLFVIAIMALLASCTPKAFEYRTYHNFSIQKLGFDKSTISMELEYYNPNNYGLQLKQSDLDIFIDGNLLGHSITDTLINIPSRSNFTMPVKFSVDMKNIIKNAASTIFGKEILVRLSGKVKVGKGNVFLSFPIEYESTQKFTLW